MQRAASLPIPAFIFILLLIAMPAVGRDYHVPADEETIQNAITAASDGDRVVVADGTYDGNGFFNIDFFGKAITVTSENGPDACTIDCLDGGRGFIFRNGEGAGSVLEGFTVINGSAHHGAAVYCYYASPTIRGNVFTSNTAQYGGGAIHCYQSSPLIEHNVIDFNSADLGGGINCRHSSPTIRHNRVDRNSATGGEGGGLRFENSAALVLNNQITDNTAHTWGGGIACREASPTIRNCTIANNTATVFGGGIGCMESSSPTVTSSILYGDTADDGAEIGLRSYINPSRLGISYSCVAGGEAGAYLETGCVLNWWGGNIDADPLFVSSVFGDYYLEQAAAGQSNTSACVDRGDPAGPMIDGTTRTDSAQDTGVVDMGCHYETWEEPVTTIDGGPSGLCNSPVYVFAFSGTDNRDPDSALRFSWRLDEEAWSDWSAVRSVIYRDLDFGNYTFSVRARDRDGNIDATPATRFFTFINWNDGDDWGPLVTGPGPGPVNPALVRSAEGEWEAYPGGRYGVNVACGNIDGLYKDEIITGPGPGDSLGPHVRGWYAGGTAMSGVSFLAYGTPRYGVNVACGNLDGDMKDEIITGAGPGAVFGPHVRAWSYSAGSVSAVDGVNFMAYGTLRWGVNVACGDLDGDGMDEIVTGPGPGDVFGPHVRGWNHDGGAATEPIAAVSFFAYNTLRYGVNVACGDLDGDGMDEIITGPGPSNRFGARVRGWNYDGEEISEIGWADFLSSPDVHGVVVASWDLDKDGLDDIITMPGAGSGLSAKLQAFKQGESGVELLSDYDFLAYDYWMSHGGRVAGGTFTVGE